MRLKAGVVIIAACVASLVLAGCGGGGGGAKHTYIVTPSSPLAAGIYITIISPVALPQSVLDRAKKNVTFVDNAVGKEVCSESKKIEGVKGKYADLNGKTVTVKVNGSNPFISQVCTALQKGRFNPSSIAGK